MGMGWVTRLTDRVDAAWLAITATQEGVPMSYEQIEIQRDCEAVQIPQGNTVIIPSGTVAFLTQSLGGSYTLQVPSLGGLFESLGRMPKRLE